MAASAMAKIYFAQVKSGKRQLDEVPALWREEVREMLETED